MAKILVLYAHPAQKQSRINRLMAESVTGLEMITVVDLYARYPRFKIDVDREQEQLIANDIIVLQFPFYWYSTPSLLKEWLDLVLEYGFAYGSGGNKLVGKKLLTAISTGGAQEDYQTSGKNRFELRSLLSPIEQTANLCQMPFLPPLVISSAHDADTDGRALQHAQCYTDFLLAMADERIEPHQLQSHSLLTLDTLLAMQGQR